MKLSYRFASIIMHIVAFSIFLFLSDHASPCSLKRKQLSGFREQKKIMLKTNIPFECCIKISVSNTLTHIYTYI